MPLADRRFLGKPFIVGLELDTDDDPQDHVTVAETWNKTDAESQLVNMSFPSWPLLIAFCAIGTRVLVAAPIKLEPVTATTGSESRFAEAVDGIETPENGWVVPQATEQTGVFRCVPPVEAGRVRFSLAFRRPEKSTYFGEFLISATTDPNPSPESHWDAVFPMAVTTDRGLMQRPYPHLRMLGAVQDVSVRIGGVLADDHVTGIRIEIFPAEGGSPAVLTELSMERLPVLSTNIALGCPVTSSLPLPEKQYPGFLTDGVADTFAHPTEASSGAGFYFEIDLRRSLTLDHISLRSRSESSTMNRFTHLYLQLFDEKPTADTRPRWTAQIREAGSVPEPGAVDVVRGAEGEGDFRGRYLRIFSSSSVPFSPQIAEVEVYESIVAPGVELWANGHPLSAQARVKIPAGVSWFDFKLGQPALRDALPLGARWRILGAGDDWSLAEPSGEIEKRGLPPGEYLFEAQLRHTDLEWNSASLRLPLVVLMPWWKKPVAQVAAAIALAASAALLAWQIERRRLARRLAELERGQELNKERARIARDMHDVVGARLTQLALMQELFATRHPLTEGATIQLHELTATAREAAAALDETMWAVNPRNDTLQNVADYLCHTASSYLRPLDIRLRQHAPDAWPEREVAAQKRHQLLLAFKEALQNIVKHAGATLVTLTLRFEESVMIIHVDDNGRGLPPETDGAEKDGLENMRIRLAGVGGTCVTQTRAEGGTRVELRLPI